MESVTEARSQGIEGDWQGMIGEMKRRLVVRIAAVDDAGWKATFHPIDQTMQAIPIDSVALEGQSLKLAISAINGDYEGTISAGAYSIAGIWQAQGNRRRSNCGARRRNPLGWLPPLLITWSL
jgi:hypothetical protein